MQVVELTKEKYQEWDKFCLESDDAWFWHTSKCLEYNLNYNPKAKPESKSFMVVRDKKTVAICLLILELNKGITEFSFGGYNGPMPAFANDLPRKEKEKIMKLIFKQIDKLAKENDVKRIRFRSSPLSKSSLGSKEYNSPMRFSYLDTSINTQLIDLKKSLEELRKEVRHGHDADIDGAAKELNYEVFDKKNITEENFDGYVELHHKDHPGATRPKITYKIMYDWVKQGSAFLVCVKKDNKAIGYSYFFSYKENAYYGSTCDKREEYDLPISHLMQWVAIEYMKKHNYKFYEIGWQKYSNTLTSFPSDKELHIGRFKRGFGGFTVSLFMAEKYYDKEFFLKIYQERIKKYSNELKND